MRWVRSGFDEARGRRHLLEVRCGIADRSHENRFFRYFVSQVKDHFERVGIDGLLVGMPECRVRENLQMDALLITDASMTIIDFKDYDDCEVRLPDEADFERGLWATDKGFHIKGGSSRNPYAQLMRQRGWLKEILDRFCRHKLGKFDAGHISTMVCFTGNVSLRGDIPGWAKLKFFICDSNSFLERLYDIANVRTVELLSSDFSTSLFDRLFEAQPYDCDMKPTSPFVRETDLQQKTTSRLEGMTGAPSQGADAIRKFFGGDSDVLVVSSIDSEERTALALAAQEAAHGAGFTEAMILSPTKLAGEHLCSGLPLDGSVYSEIYDFTSRKRDRDGIEHVRLSRPPSALSLRYEADTDGAAAEVVRTASDEKDRVALVICESQLVTSSAWLDGSVVFGSGRLLSDILEYLSVDEDNKGRNKVVFIGDDCLLGAGSRTKSSLREEAYPRGISVQKISMPLPKAAEGPEGLANRLARGIRLNDLSLLSADELPDTQRVSSSEERWALIGDAASNWRTHKLITYSNKRARDVGISIKKYVLRNGESLCNGDVLLFNGQFEALACDTAQDGFTTRTMRNGEFATVSYVSDMHLSIPVASDISDEAESLTLVPIRFYPEGSVEEYEACVIKEYLESPKPELSMAQEQAIRIRLNSLEREERNRHPFAPGNRLYDSMIKDGDYIVARNSKGHLSYRSKEDQRRRHRCWDAYLREIHERVQSLGTEYYRVANAVRARYGWAVTAHKAQSYYWDEVALTALDDGLGRHSGQYFRYLYTGASRAVQGLTLVSWHDITPFDGTTVRSADATTRTSSRKRTLFKLDCETPPRDAIPSALKGLELGGMTIEHVGSSNYQERFEFARAEKSVIVAFSYNKKHEVGSLVRQKGDEGLFLELKDAIDSAALPSVDESPMGFAYEYLERLLGGDSTVKVTRSTRYRDEIEIVVGGMRCRAAAYYDSKHLVSSLVMLSGSSEAFEKVRGAVDKMGGE